MHRLVFTTGLLITTALTPASAADMTTERALNPQREPQNWILHHGNYQGHRYSLLKDINTDTVKNLKPAFTVALGGFQSAAAMPTAISKQPPSSKTASSMYRTAGVRCTRST